jgi:hypothetical protein
MTVRVTKVTQKEANPHPLTPYCVKAVMVVSVATVFPPFYLTRSNSWLGWPCPKGMRLGRLKRGGAAFMNPKTTGQLAPRRERRRRFDSTPHEGPGTGSRL